MDPLLERAVQNWLRETRYSALVVRIGADVAPAGAIAGWTTDSMRVAEVLDAARAFVCERLGLVDRD